MKTILSSGIFILVLLGMFTNPVLGQNNDTSHLNSEDEDKCDFSRYKPLKDPHSLLNAALKTKKPEYPAAAKLAKIEGKVIVRILVNRKGDVVDACVAEGPKLLHFVSLQAAKRWQFKKHFGFADHRPKKKYAETDLRFTFKLPEQKSLMKLASKF
ncbi:MAG: TonB family protein [Acidobacteria bacterium]|nr:TonB family protein [Acidobacteriota bacterium]